MRLSPERAWALEAAERYWPRRGDVVGRLPIPEAPASPEALPPVAARVPLPDWAADVGVSGGLLVPGHARAGGANQDWRAVDWLRVMFWYLSGAAERAFEAAHGPVHSYRFRLEGWDDAIWDHAWVNRTALFLRRWSAREAQREERDLFGPLPEPEVVITHDVDAIRKTSAIRLKQSAFHAFNAARRLGAGDSLRALEKASEALRFLISADDYWCFERIRALEEKSGVRSHFNVYAGPSGWRFDLRSLVIDPGYSPEDARLAGCLCELRAKGWSIGLHQSFGAWEDAAAMRRERERLERVIGGPVTSCRQHWLKFSWTDTWKAQAEAGLELDSTLGFNDRPGFRNGAALRVHPWDPSSQRALALESLPMVLMDSHLYDYADVRGAAALASMDRWVSEIVAVRGQATVLWHQQSMSRDYGWAGGFEALLEMCARYATRS